MEQDQIFSNDFSSVPENTDFDPRQLQASASNAPVFNPNPNFSSQIVYHTFPPAAFRNSESHFIPEQPAECNSETNFPSDPTQASACSFEGEYEEEEECTCESDSDSDSSSNEECDNRAILEEIVNELYEELIIEHCFQVHQAFKLGAYIDEENEVESQIPEETSVSNSIKCPSCNKEHELQNYKNKLGECMGLTTRKSKRTPKTKVTSFAELSNDSSSNGRKTTGKKRKQQSRKGNPKNAKVKIQSRDSGNPFPDFPSTSWQPDYYAANPKKYCGQITKSGTRCMKAPNCSTHKTEIKTTTHFPDSSFSRSSQCYKEELYPSNIDFDTVDTNSRDLVQRARTSDSYSCSTSDFSNPAVTRSEKNGKIKMIIKTDGQKKKKKPKFESTYSSHLFDPTYPGLK